MLELLIAASQTATLVVHGILATLGHVAEVLLEVVKTATGHRHVQIAIDLVQHIVVLLEDFILLLERHMADSVIGVDKLLYLVLCILHALPGKFLELSDDVALLLEVGLLFRTCAGMSSVACIEEVVASREELVPQLVAELLWHSTDRLPLLLQSDKLISRSLPVGGVGQLLRLLDEFAAA